MFYVFYDCTVCFIFLYDVYKFSVSRSVLVLYGTVLYQVPVRVREE